MPTIAYADMAFPSASNLDRSTAHAEPMTLLLTPADPGPVVRAWVRASDYPALVAAGWTIAQIGSSYDQ